MQSSAYLRDIDGLYINGCIVGKATEILEKLATTTARTLGEEASKYSDSIQKTGRIPCLAVSYRWENVDSLDMPPFSHKQLSKLDIYTQGFQMRYQSNVLMGIWVDKVYHKSLEGKNLDDLPWVEHGLIPYHKFEAAIMNSCTDASGVTNFWTMAEHVLSHSGHTSIVLPNLKFGRVVCEHTKMALGEDAAMRRLSAIYKIAKKCGARLRIDDRDGAIKRVMDKYEFDKNALQRDDLASFIPSAIIATQKG